MGMTNEAHDLRAGGCAALLELMDAARDWAGKVSGLGTMFDPEAARLVNIVEKLEILLAELRPEPAHVWVPSTWKDVHRHGPGTRVRLGGVEAVVDVISAGTWHVDPRSPSRNPRPLERTLITVKLMGREQTYDFPAGNAVEVQDVKWPTVTEADWAAAAMAAQEERAVRLLTEAFGRVEKVAS